tara:strand:+ start:1068 stop:1268 length:201 start_codon:yes stop_codon:yes gene_type:complete
MKILLLLPLLLGFNYAVMTKSYWLVHVGEKGGMDKIEMTNMVQCQEQGQKWDTTFNMVSYVCMVSK